MSLLRKTFKDFQKRKLNCQNSLKTIIGQTLVNLLRIFLGSLICIIYSKREKFFYTFQKLNCNQEIVRLLACEDLEHKGEGSQGVFKSCKEFTKVVKNLK